MPALPKRALDAEIKRRRGAADWGAVAVGGNLYAEVASASAGRWRLRVTTDGKRRWIDMGPLDLFTLDEAREEALRLRRVIRDGGDPLAARKAVRAPAPRKPTFAEFASDLVDSLEPGFKSERHRQQWRATLGLPRGDGGAAAGWEKPHAAPLGPKPIDAITTDDVMSVLQPIWLRIPETASRLRGRIERVLDAARVRGLREGENPARWKGHLDALLPAPKKLARGHHAAMPWRDMPCFYGALTARPGVAALCLRFLISTVARSGEARGALWSEIDTRAAIWTVPAERMKADRPHRVPLSGEALRILDLARGRHPHLIFPSPRGKVASDMVFAALYKRMSVENTTTHGFRSTFRDWCQEHARADFVVAEQCLAHRVGSAVERAYARADLLEQRRELLDQWSCFASAQERRYE